MRVPAFGDILGFELITELLDQSRIEAGKLEVIPAEVNLLKCVNDAVEQLRPEALAKRQDLKVTAAGPEMTVWADGDRLVQIITNLVHNAIKFTPEQGSITVCLGPEGPDFARVSVIDTGPGIPPEALNKIFNPFFQLKQGYRGGPKGLGLEGRMRSIRRPSNDVMQLPSR